MRRRYPVAEYTEQTDEDGHKRQVRSTRKGKVELTGDHLGLLAKLEISRVEKMAHNIIARYVHEEIDAAYIVYNEFKSVISQRLVVEKLLPLIEVGKQQIAGAVEPSRRREGTRGRGCAFGGHRD